MNFTELFRIVIVVVFVCVFCGAKANKGLGAPGQWCVVITNAVMRLHINTKFYANIESE